MKELLVFTGPTASGKSEICRRVVENYRRAIVINCDSRQVYSGLPSITDQPAFLLNNEQFKLYSYVPPYLNYSVGLWLEDAKKEILHAWNSGLFPIISGGSGLYVSSLINGLSAIPTVSSAIRQKARSLFKSLGKDEFYELLLQKDSKAQRIHKNNSHQLLRAFEVIEQTGISILTWREREPRQKVFERCRVCVLLPQRQELYDKINARFISMLSSSAIPEVKHLMSLNLPEYMPIMRTTGVPEIMQYLQGKMSLSEATEIAQRRTRQYAKRQYTWFKNQLPPDTLVFENQEDVFTYIASTIPEK